MPRNGETVMNSEFKTNMGHQAFIRELIKSDARQVLEYLKLVGGETNYLLIDERGIELSVGEEADVLERYYNHPISQLIGCFIEDEIVAIANLTVSDKLRIRHIAKVGVSVKKKFWRQKIGFKMMQILIDYAKKNHQLNIVQLEVRTDNFSAISLYETLGFKYVGTMPKAMKLDGKFYDHNLMFLDV